MIRILNHKEQNEVYKRLVNMIVELMRRDEVSAKDAVIDAFEIAYIVGGKEMLEAMKVKK